MERSRPLTLALCGGYFFVLLDVTVVNVALPSIGAGLHATAAGLAWVVDAYTVPLAALLLAAGAIGDRLGHRRVIVTGFIGFGGASVWCALAPALPLLIAGRALQGGCAALMLPGTLAMLTASAPDDRARARTVGLWAAVGGAALPAGPLVGGLLAEVAGWRAVFWLSVPVIIAALIPVLTMTAADRGKSSRRADWPGAAALVVVLGAAVTAVIEARTNPRVSIGMVALIVLASLVLWRIERAADSPLLVVPVAARRPLVVACVVAGLMNLCMIGSLFLLTQLLQDVHHRTPLTAGLLLLPAMLPLPLVGTAAGRLTHRIGPWRTSAIGLAVAAAGFAGMAESVAHAGYPALLAAFACWGAGVGILAPAIVAAALQAIPSAPGVASGASNTARQTGGALGVAIFAAFAGSAHGTAFTQHTGWLLAGCAAVFAAAAAVLLSGSSRPAGAARRGSPRGATG